MMTIAVAIDNGGAAFDLIIAFQQWCSVWAGRYARGDVSLQRVVDLLAAIAPSDLTVYQAQAIIADAITLATEDEYEGLSPSFARACKLADEHEAARKQNQACDRRLKTRRRVAQSTLDAAEFLIRQNDPARFERWLLEHPAHERAAIVAHIRAKP